MIFEPAKKIFLTLVISSLVGCVSLSEDEAERPPQLTKDTPVAELVAAGAKFGGQTLNDAKKQIDKRKAWDAAHQCAERTILEGYETLPPKTFLNTVHFYQTANRKISLAVVEALVRSEKPLARQVGWQLATHFPSREVAVFMEAELSRAIWDSDEEVILIPEMAEAAVANGLKSTYTLMKQGLLTQGDPAYANAMRIFDPGKATYDFVDYIGGASIEDLRQLNQSTVNLQACVIALRHLQEAGVPLSHPKIDYVFLYAVSRNPLLSELANHIIEKQIVTDREHLAFVLARLPAWIQVAYIEEVRHNLSPGMGNFLAQLRKVTSHKEVVEEIGTIAN